MPQSGQRGLIGKSTNPRPRDKTSLAIPQTIPHTQRRFGARGRKPILGAQDLQLHHQLMHDGRLKSGRVGAFVYYVRKGRQHSRPYVVPRDPRTPAQQRCRAIFGAASRTWSAAGTLTDQQRDAWRAEGAKTRSHPRLGSSGKLTGQQHFVGRTCAKEKQNEVIQTCQPMLVAEMMQCQWVTRSTWDHHRTNTGALPWHCRRNTLQARHDRRIVSLLRLPGFNSARQDPRTPARWRGG